MNSAIEFYILELVCVPDFSLNWQFWFFESNLPKKWCFWSKTRVKKSEHHHSILHNRISLGITNISLNWQFWSFFYQICPKSVFPAENRKIALVRASMVFTYYIKLFCTGADRHNGILMFLLMYFNGILMFLVAETSRKFLLKNI